MVVKNHKTNNSQTQNNIKTLNFIVNIFRILTISRSFHLMHNFCKVYYLLLKKSQARFVLTLAVMWKGTNGIIQLSDLFSLSFKGFSFLITDIFI